MEKITVKDINKLLPMGKKIKIRTKRAIALPKRIFNSVKKAYHNAKAKLESYVPEDVKKEALKQKIGKLEEKRKELDKLKRQMKKQDEFTTGNKMYYLEAVEEELQKIRDKKKKRKSKGLGKFALAKLALSTYIKSRNKKRSLKKNFKQQLIIEKDELEIAEELEAAREAKSEKQEKIKAILDANPDLVEYYTSLIEKNEEKKEKTR